MRDLVKERPSPPATIAVRVNRAFEHVANGALLYVLFAAVGWFLASKGALIAERMFGDVVWPVGVSHGLMPLAASAVATFGALAGLRWALRRGRLRLSTSEHSATAIFIAVVFLFSVAGAALDWEEGVEPWWLAHLSVWIGALLGVAARRRVRL